MLIYHQSEARAGRVETICPGETACERDLLTPGSLRRPEELGEKECNSSYENVGGGDFLRDETLI